MENMLKRFLASLLAAVMLLGTAAAAQASVMTLPEGIQTIEAETFDGTDALDSVVLPEGITAIGSRAFADSSISSINLPRSITSIAADAFDNCPNLTAVVKSGSYAMEFCKENGIPYKVEAVVQPTSGNPISVSSAAKSVKMGNRVEITLSSDDGRELTGDQRIYYSIIFLNADDEVINVWSYGNDQVGTSSLWPECAGAVKMLITVTNGNGTCPGKNPSVEIAITGSTDYAYYDVSLDGMGYPGGKLRMTVQAMNADKMTKSQAVVVKDNVGHFNKTIGTLSKTNPKVMADVTIPRDFKVYNDQGEENDFYYTITVGGDEVERYWPWMQSFCDHSVTARVGGATMMDVLIVPSEMPYTYAIADTKIAKIDQNGVITGVKEGKTTGTLTTKNGTVTKFNVTVKAAGGSAVEAEPVFYVTAPANTYLYGTDEEAIFRIYSETENSLRLGKDIPVTLNFYDDSEELVGSVDDTVWVNSSGEFIYVWTSWSWWDNRVGEGYRYVEMCLDEAEIGYDVVEPSSARVQVIYPEELGKLAFKLDDTWGEHSAGDTVTLQLTCTTPGLLAEKAKKGDVKVTAVSDYAALDIISNVQPAVFDEDTSTATLTFTVGEDVLPGDYYQIMLYCGTNEVGSYGMDIFSGLARLSSYVDMLAGESCKLPFALAEGANADNLYFTISDPSIATVDQNGVVTAHQVGFAEAEIYYQGRYGNTGSCWIDINVYEPASEDVPTLTVAPTSTSAVYGKPVPVKVQLSDLITDANGDPAEVWFELRTSFLDANGSTLTNYSRSYGYSADELVGDGVIVDMNNWITSSDVYSVASMVIIPSYYSEAPEYALDFDYTRIPVTGIPERGEVVYQFSLNSEGEILHGQYVYFRVSRMPNATGADAEVTVRDAEGNVLCTETFYDGDRYCSPRFDTDDLEPGKTYTVYLYVDDEKIKDAEVSFALEEAQLYLDFYNRRMTIGETDEVSYRFSSNDYDCDVTITSSDPSVLSIDEENTVTAHKAGTATITAECKHGRTDSENVIVYNPEGTGVPVVGIYPNENQTVSWMDSLGFELGVSGDFTQIPKDYLYAYYYVQFLDAEKNVLYDTREKDDLMLRDGYLGMYDVTLSLTTDLEYSSFNYYEDWLKGAELGASYIRLRLANVGFNSYTIDSDHSYITIALPAVTECERPIVKYEYTTAIGEGQAITATFTCMNPKSLTESKEVSLWDDSSDTALARGYLTKDNPSVTLSYTPDEDFTSGQFHISYPQGYGSSSQYFWVQRSLLKSLGENQKVSIGSYAYLYPSFDGASQKLSFTSSDDTVVSYEWRNNYYLYVTGLKAGTAVITGTTPSGQSQSVTVVVYDPDSTTAPHITVDQDQDVQLDWFSDAKIAISTTSEPSTFGNVTLRYQLEYLNASGSVINSEIDYSNASGSFATQNDCISIGLSSRYDLAQLYAKGARSIRFTLLDYNDYYTFDESSASVTLTIADPAAETEPIIYFTLPDYVIGGESFTATIGCLNPSILAEGVACEIYHTSSDTREVTLTASNPTATQSFDVPQNGGNDYQMYFRAGGYAIYKYLPVLRGYISNSGTLSVGNTRQLSYYFYVNADGLTAEWESANPEVATVDQTGLVTGVAPGQTDILVHYGPLTLTGGVRVYDSSAASVTPEFYITTSDTVVKPDTSIQYAFGTNSDLADLTSSYYYIYYSVTGVDDSGEVVYVRNSSWDDSFYFAEGSEEADTFYLSGSDLAQFVASGATRVCFSLLKKDSYDIDSDRASIMVPIQDPGEWTGTNIGIAMPDTVIWGETVTIPVKWISAASTYADKTCTVTLSVRDQNDNYLLDNEQVTISKDSTDAAFTFTVPQINSNLYYEYAYRFEGSSSNYKTGSDSSNVMYFSATQKDTALAINSTMKGSYSGSNLYNYTWSYESSDPDVASVDANGTVTGVAAGVTTITVRYGKLSDTYLVRVYDSSTMVNAKLSLSAPQGMTEWPWTGEGDLVITADQPVKKLGYINYVYVYSYYLDKNGDQVGYDNGTYYPALIDSNTQTIHIVNDDMDAYAAEGAVSVMHKITSVYGGGFSIDTSANSVTLPMQALSDTTDPMISVKEGLSSTSMVSGKQYTMTVEAINTTVNTPQTVSAYTRISGIRYELGSVTFTPSESAEATLTVTAPSGVTVTSFTLYVNVPKGDGVYKDLSQNYYCYLTPLPSLTAVSTLAELQSEHSYANNLNKAWSYTVEGATSLAVTFDGQTRTESANFDPLKVGSLSAFEEGSLENTYGSSIGAITVDVTGDTVVIWLKSDSSSTYYGFAVTQIVATMADGSTVTITG